VCQKIASNLTLDQAIRQSRGPLGLAFSRDEDKRPSTRQSGAPVLNILLPALTSLLAFIFVGVMLQRFISGGHRPYHLVWAVGLLWYALATGSEAVGGAFGWSAGLYRIWYITGAIGVAAYLGAGTLFVHRDPAFGALAVVCVLGAGVPALATDHLVIGFLGLGSAVVLAAVLSLRPQAFAVVALVLLIAGSIAAALVIVAGPVDVSVLPTSSNQIVQGDGFDAQVRALTPPFNIAGALILILGALASALYFWRTRTASNRVASNVLIAVGAFVPSVASGLTRFGVTSLFFAGELVGLACILAGFVLSGSARSKQTLS
jgi:hypothetical protein